MKSFQKISYILFAFVIFTSPVIIANEFGITDSKLKMINSKVSSMGYSELLDSRSSLLKERSDLLLQNDNTQSPSQRKANGSRLAEISAELSAIQKALVAVVGVAALTSIAGGDPSPDTIPPVITISGSASVTVELGDVYTDAGATASDANDGVVSVTTTSNVDTSAVGTYTVTYTATDISGNTATRTRTVEVVDTTAPVVTVTGDNPATVELGTAYTDAGATATDASGDVTVVTTGAVDTDTIGEYTLTYTSTDASDNAGTATRTVNVVDTTVPVFTSSSTFVIDEGETDVGTVTATDLQTVTFSIVSDVLSITTAGVLSIDADASDYEAQSDNPVNLPYDGSTYDITATVTATDAS